jgi:hypothetical protein
LLLHEKYRLELSNTLRIRDKEATIKQLEFPKDTLNKLQKLVSSNVTEDVKKLGIKKLTGVSRCCGCGGIPTHEIIYNVENATRIERYCEKCVKSIYPREAVL